MHASFAYSGHSQASEWWYPSPIKWNKWNISFNSSFIQNLNFIGPSLSPILAWHEGCCSTYQRWGGKGHLSDLWPPETLCKWKSKTTHAYWVTCFLYYITDWNTWAAFSSVSGYWGAWWGEAGQYWSRAQTEQIYCTQLMHNTHVHLLCLPANR